jgi:hypothetical protein
MLCYAEVSAAAGRLNRFDGVVVGSNLDEGRFLMPLVSPVRNAPFSSRADLKDWLELYYAGLDADQIISMYEPDIAAASPWEGAAKMYTDSQYLCPTTRSARWLDARGDRATYTYRLEHAPSFFGEIGTHVFWRSGWCGDYKRCANLTAVPIGVGHSADVHA